MRCLISIERQRNTMFVYLIAFNGNTERIVNALNVLHPHPATRLTQLVVVIVSSTMTKRIENSQTQPKMQFDIA